MFVVVCDVIVVELRKFGGARGAEVTRFSAKVGLLLLARPWVEGNKGKQILRQKSSAILLTLRYV